jgi:hypothetical protein
MARAARVVEVKDFMLMLVGTMRSSACAEEEEEVKA